MKCTTVINGGTPEESRIFDTGDADWPFEIRTPRGNWRTTDLPPALYVANVAGRGVPRRPIVFRDGPIHTYGQPVEEVAP